MKGKVQEMKPWYVQWASRAMPCLLTVLLIIIGAGCETQKTIDTLPPGTPKGYVEFHVTGGGVTMEEFSYNALTGQKFPSVTLGSIYGNSYVFYSLSRSLRVAASPGVHYYRTTSEGDNLGEQQVVVIKGTITKVNVDLIYSYMGTENRGYGVEYKRYIVTASITVDIPVLIQ